MNERIKLLSNQALDSAVPYTWTTLSYDEVMKLQEKFAELIIEECSTVIEQNLFRNIGYNTSRAVRKHFGIGVEE